MKKIVCLVLALVMTFGLFAVTASADSRALIGRYGDADGNGVSNATDALYILRVAVGKQKLDYDIMCYLDVNGDIKISASDALEILKYTVGKINSYSVADSYQYTVNVMANDIYLQQGGTAVIGVMCDDPGAFTVKSVYYADEPILWVSWDDAWMFPNENYTTVHISPNIAVTKELVVPVKIYYEEHPSVYEVVNIHIVPEQNEPFNSPSYPGVPDFGDYTRTSPEWGDTDFVNNDTITVSLCYDIPTVLANGNGGDCYQNFLKIMDNKLTFVSGEKLDTGYYYNVYRTKDDKYTVALWLQDMEGVQKLFVHMEGKF